MPCSCPEGAGRRRPAALVARALLLAGLLGGCSKARDSNFSFLSSPADGTPTSCPDDAVDPGGPGGGPMAPRCSYENKKTGMVQLRGTVLLEGAGSPDVPAEGMRVTVHRDDGGAQVGRQIGRTLSDPQGRFSVSLSTGPGAYRLRAVAEDTGAVLAERPFVIPQGATTVGGLDIVLPVDPALR